jgi:hypothetical protein
MTFSREELAALQRLVGHRTIYALATGEPARGTPPAVVPRRWPSGTAGREPGDGIPCVAPAGCLGGQS